MQNNDSKESLQNPNFGHAVKFYRNNVAFCAQAVSTRGNSPTHTINIEMAPVYTNGGANWLQKIIVQVSPLELPRFTALLLGWKTAMKAEFHGHNNNKGYECKHQEDNVFIQLTNAGKWLNFNLNMEEVFLLSQLAIAQLQKAMPNATAGDVMNLLRLTVCRQKAPG